MPSHPSAFYVYMLVDPRTGIPFYVGKGQQNRAWHHAAAVGRGDLSGNARKVAKIQEILTRGDEAEIQIVAEYDLEDDALEHEFELVDSMIELTNVMPGGGGGPGGRRLTASEIAARVEARRKRIEGRAKTVFLGRKGKKLATNIKQWRSVPNAHLHASAIEAWVQRQASEQPSESSLGLNKRRAGRFSAYDLNAAHKRKRQPPEYVKDVWQAQNEASNEHDRIELRGKPGLSKRQREILAEGSGPMGLKSGKR